VFLVRFFRALPAFSLLAAFLDPQNLLLHPMKKQTAGRKFCWLRVVST
jgi:hypothetical protein